MDVLVLSSSYEPISQITWQRAMTLLVNGLIEVHEEYEDWDVRTVRRTFKVPAVVRFLKGRTHWKRGIRFSRENIFVRDKGRCAYCGDTVSKALFTFDHVIPRNQGGQTRWENVVCACLACNQKKGGRTPAQAGMHLRVQPEKPRSLPGTVRMALPDQVPEAWKPYLRSFGYWHGELDSES